MTVLYTCRHFLINCQISHILKLLRLCLFPTDWLSETALILTQRCPGQRAWHRLSVRICTFFNNYPFETLQFIKRNFLRPQKGIHIFNSHSGARTALILTRRCPGQRWVNSLEIIYPNPLFMWWSIFAYGFNFMCRKPRGIIDTAKSSSALSLTPCQKHRGIKLSQVIDIVE